MIRNLTATVLFVLFILIGTACTSAVPTDESGEPTNTPPPTSQPTAQPAATATITVEQEVEETAPNNVFTTKIGDFLVDSSHLQDEVIGGDAGENSKFLLVVLTHADGSPIDPETFDLEAFQEIREGQVEIKWNELPNYSLDHLMKSDDDRYFAICPMGGWLNDDFVVGCTVPAPADEYWFVWGYEGENEPILLTPEM